MLIPSLSSNFIFNFPNDFLPRDVISDYGGLIDQFHLPYENVIDLLNSTIKSVSCPGLKIETVKQNILRGKEINYKPSKPVQDILSSHEFVVTFGSVLCDINYMLCFDIFQKHYLDIANYIEPFVVIALDPWRNGFYKFKYYQLIAVDLSDNTFDYSVQKINPKEFTMTFKFNFMELELLINKKKILDLGNKNVLGNSSPLILNR